jgi:hypothetical protein
MRNAEMAESFTIFAKYEDVANTHAEHDEFWAGPTDAGSMSAEDVKRLAEIGWTRDEDGGFHLFT